MAHLTNHLVRASRLAFLAAIATAAVYADSFSWTLTGTTIVTGEPITVTSMYNPSLIIANGGSYYSGAQYEGYSLPVHDIGIINIVTFEGITTDYFSWQGTSNSVWMDPDSNGGWEYLSTAGTSSFTIDTISPWSPGTLENQYLLSSIMAGSWFGLINGTEVLFTPAVAPEPGTWVLAGVGMLALAIVRKRRAATAATH